MSPIPERIPGPTATMVGLFGLFGPTGSFGPTGRTSAAGTGLAPGHGWGNRSAR